MKKVLCFLCTLVLLITGLTAAVGVSLYREADKVTYRLIDEWGDREYLSGITAEIDYTLNGHLNWSSEFSPLAESKSMLTFDKVAARDNSFRYTGFYGNGFRFFDLKNDNERLNADLESLKAEAANPGDIRTREFKFRDYYEYYPVSFDLSMGEIGISWEPGFGFYGEGKYVFSGITPARGNGLINAMNDYFRIPVPEEDIRLVKVHAGDGNSYSWSTTYRAAFDFMFFNTVSSDTLYFTFSNEISTEYGDKRVLCDTSLIPGGYGIYAVPYSESDIKYEQLETVYSIPSDSTVQALMHNEERKELYLVLHENESLQLHIIDESTMTDITVIDLFSFSFEDFLRTYEYEDFFVIIKNDTDFTVVARDSDGIFEIAFSGVMPLETVADRDYFSYYSRFAFDGERLAVLAIENPGVEEIKIMSIQPDIMVFTKDGVQYYGKWISSLGTPITDSIVNYVRKTDYSIRID